MAMPRCKQAAKQIGDMSDAPWQPILTWYSSAKAAIFFIGVSPPPCETVIRR